MSDAVSGLFDDDTPRSAPRRPPGGQQRSRALLGTIIVLVAAFFLVSLFAGVWTDRLWFRERRLLRACSPGALDPGRCCSWSSGC